MFTTTMLGAFPKFSVQVKLPVVPSVSSTRRSSGEKSTE